MKLSYDSEGNYHDDDIRIEAYSESADLHRDVFVDEVVNQIEREIGDRLRMQPNKTVKEIKIMAMHRFLDLIEKKLLSVSEAERCYQRFSQQVDFYYDGNS